MIDIKGVDKAKLLVELYNYSCHQGLETQQQKERLTIEDAREMLKRSSYFDHIFGTAIKVDLTSDEKIEEILYDSNNGQGAAQIIVNNIKEERKNNEVTRQKVKQKLR